MEKETSFKKWYRANKDKINSARKKRYQEDPAYREVILAREADRRTRMPRPSRVGISRYKTVNGQVVETFRITEAGGLIGRSPQTIRGWEEDGLIPAPLVRGSHRHYTKVQIDLMRELAGVFDELRHAGKQVLDLAVEAKKKEIYHRWGEL